MKKMISVCLLFVLIASGALWVDHRLSGEDNRTPEPAVTTEEGTALSQNVMAQDGAKYQAVFSGGKVVIYHTGTEEIFCETAISYERLPKEMREAIGNGLYFQNEMELYEFLENYSS